MTTGAVLRAMAHLALAYAALGVIATLVLALLGSSLDDDGLTLSLLAPLVVLALALALAAVIIVLLARLTAGWLQGRVREPVVGAIMAACALVLLSGALTVTSLGMAGLAASAVLALATHLVLTRWWT